MSEGKTSKYFKYAIGEILLVVIGILIALQINNWNEARKERAKEVNYLQNLKTDLEGEIVNNENFAKYRFDKASTCSALLNGSEPKTIEDVEKYTYSYEHVFIWSDFSPNQNTFKELLSSGNLSLIKNDSIKNGLLELDKMYAEITTGEHHMRREYEAYLYDPHVENVTALGFFDLSKPSLGLPARINVEDIPTDRQDQLIQEAKWQHHNAVFKNGLRLAFMNNGYLAGIHETIAIYIKQLIALIDREINQ